MSCNGPEALQKWADVVGMRFLGHLQHVCVSFEWHKDLRDHVRVEWTPEAGLKATFWDQDRNENDGDNDESAAKFCAMVERRKQEERWESTGIIECFLADPDALREAIYGPFELEEE